MIEGGRKMLLSQFVLVEVSIVCQFDANLSSSESSVNVTWGAL
jgi:hypothetical protein